MKLRTGITSPTLGNSPPRQARILLLNLSDDDDDLMEQLQLFLQQLTAGKLVHHDNLLNQLNQLNLLMNQLNLLMNQLNLVNVNVDLRRMRMILMSLFY